MNHQVNRLKFDIECATEEQAFDLRQSIVHMQEELIASIDQVASQLTGEEEVIHIEKLEIDLGETSFQAFGNRLPADFRIMFEQTLLRYISQRQAIGHSKTLSDNKLEVLLFFLETGSLPWWSADAEPDLDILLQEVIQLHSKKFTDFLYKIRHNKSSWKRIAFQFNRHSKSQLIKLVPAFRYLHARVTIRLANEPGWTNIQHDIEKTAALIDELLLFNAGRIMSEYDHDTTCEKMMQQLKWIIENKATPTWQALEIKERKEQEFAENILENIEPNVVNADKQAKTYAIKYSGIVIAAPFLPAVFEKLGLVKDSQFVSWNARCKAVQLVTSIATGAKAHPEYMLTLAKVICGMDADDTLPYDVSLETEELNEINELLSSIIYHWQALKNTSAEALRENFFKRDGSLQKTENGWLLRVEQKSWDALFTKLNWGFSTLAFPWNDYLISVEWHI